ncbi:MAG: tRNA (guanosine(46)-N7)-methyltransferase TrmB [Brachymonas sp.]|nr:tRNA (guanosine(46)-N7)-methyltransferase TrmB [Brachymonas sp.]
MTTEDHTVGAEASTAHHRPIRSFVLRTGRMGTGQERALAELGPRYMLPFEPKRLDLDTLKSIALRADSMPSSGQKGLKNDLLNTPVVLEIGFGMGDATAKIAQHLPDTLFLACEVHTPGVGALLRLIGEQQIPNIRIIQHDAVEVLAQMIAKESLDGIHIFFPDPWHKKRHHKRRLIQPAFVAKLMQHLKPGGYLHLATDWQPYAEQMLEVLSQEPLLHNTATDYAPRPDYRPETKFERRGLKLGHGVWDLVFKKKPSPL